MVLADGRLAPDESDKILITPLSLITLHVEKYSKTHSALWNDLDKIGKK